MIIFTRIWLWLIIPWKFKKIYNPFSGLSDEEIKYGQEVAKRHGLLDKKFGG